MLNASQNTAHNPRTEAGIVQIPDMYYDVLAHLCVNRSDLHFGLD